MGGAMAAKLRRERGVAVEDARKAERLERRQMAMDRWVGGWVLRWVGARVQADGQV